MATLTRLSNHKVLLCMWPDHVPPHCHLKGPGWAASINIETLQVMRGDPPAEYLEEAREWIRANRDFVRQEWERLNERDD